MHRVTKAGLISHSLPESKHSRVLAFNDTSSDALCVPAFADPHHANAVGCNAYHDYTSSKRCNKWDGAIPLRIHTQDLHIQTTGPNKVVYWYRTLHGTDNSVHQGRGERLCRTGVGLSCGRLQVCRICTYFQGWDCVYLWFAISLHVFRTEYCFLFSLHGHHWFFLWIGRSYGLDSLFYLLSCSHSSRFVALELWNTPWSRFT